jgi:hypothetical protein
MMSLYVWFTPLDGLGEQCLDLATCRRFVCAVRGRDADHDLVYYESPDRPVRWFRYTCFPDPDGDAESYAEAGGPEVAYEVLHVARFDGRLTRDLEPYREFGDDAKYTAWIAGTNAESGRDDRPSWDAESGVFRIGGWGRRVAPQAKKQRQVLDALEAAGWPPHAVPVGIGDLYETAREIGQWLRPTRFRIARENGAIRWTRRP